MTIVKRVVLKSPGLSRMLFCNSLRTIEDGEDQKNGVKNVEENKYDTDTCLLESSRLGGERAAVDSIKYYSLMYQNIQRTAVVDNYYLF